MGQPLEWIIQSREWLNSMAGRHHYMHQAVHQRASPFGWALAVDGCIFRPDGRPMGFIIFASIHFTCMRGEFGYPGLPTKWQVLNLARFWLHPDLQRGGELYNPVLLPGFTDRKGVFRSTLASDVIKMALGLVQRRWLEVHPPPFPEQPYHIRKVISYANTQLFEGTIYRAAGFRECGRTISRKRHKDSRGPGIGKVKLIRFIYDLDEPDWEYCPPQLKLRISGQ